MLYQRIASMPWNWGKISDLDLEIEVKRCYRSLLEAQETSENCLRTHDDVGKAMEGKATPSKGSSDRWCFINPKNSFPDKIMNKEQFNAFRSPFTSLEPTKRNSMRPTGSSSYDKAVPNGDLDTSYSLPPVRLHDDKSFFSNLSTTTLDTSITCELLTPGGRKNPEGAGDSAGLLLAVKHEQITAVQQLLKHGALVNVADDSGKSPLIHAVENGFTAIAKELLDHGAYVNQRDRNKRTPLRIATESGKKYLVSFLLKNRASVYILDEDMKAPLHYAVEKNFADIVELLLDHGAPVNQSDGNQKKPLHYAAERGYLSIVEILLSRGASIDCMDRDMRTPLILAVEKGLEVMSHTLISRGASVNAANRRRQTPLHFAAGIGFINIAEELIAKRGGVNNRDDAGKTPAFYAIRNNNVSMLNVLIQHGAQMETSDIAGKTLLRYAVETKSEAIIYLVAKAELDQCGVKRHVYHRQLQTAIQEDCDFLGKTVWNHVMDQCSRMPQDAVEHQLMATTVHLLLDATCAALSRAINHVLIKMEPQLRNDRLESPYILAHVIVLPPSRRLTYMGLPVVYEVSDFKAASSYSVQHRL